MAVQKSKKTRSRRGMRLLAFFDKSRFRPYDCAPMLTEPLPTTLDVRKAAVRGATVSGSLAVSKLDRLRPILASDDGRIDAHFGFSRDPENRSVIELSLSATVEVTCQRCLQPMPIELSAENQLAIIGDDEQARQLPSHLEPLVVAGELCDLWTVVEDELMLSLPIVSYHETKDCKQLLEDYSQPAPEHGAAEENPFSVLEQLKPGSKLRR